MRGFGQMTGQQDNQWEVIPGRQEGSWWDSKPLRVNQQAFSASRGLCWVMQDLSWWCGCSSCSAPAELPSSMWDLVP